MKKIEKFFKILKKIVSETNKLLKEIEKLEKSIIKVLGFAITIYVLLHNF